MWTTNVMGEAWTKIRRTDVEFNGNFVQKNRIKIQAEAR